MCTEAISPLRQRMIKDMNARKLSAQTQRGHIRSCKRFARHGYGRGHSPVPAAMAETGMSICNRNRIMTGVRYLFRVTLRRLDLAAEIYHLREPQKIPQVMSPDEKRRLLAVASSLKVRVLLSLGYGCGLRAGEVVRLKVKHIDRAQNIIRVEQSKGRKDRNVMLSPEMLALLRQWWKVRPTRWDASVPAEERWLAPPPFPTRDFLPWRFSAAGPRSAWRDRHSGGRKPAQVRRSCGCCDIPPNYPARTSPSLQYVSCRRDTTPIREPSNARQESPDCDRDA
jgi:integrase